MASAKSTFIAGPAAATRMRETGDAGGISASAFPSIASLVIICGNFTKPPAGIQRMLHSTPWNIHEKAFGPRPMEKPSTFIPRRRAIQ